MYVTTCKFQTAAKPAFNFGGTPATKPESSFGGATTNTFQFAGPNTEGSGDTMDASSSSQSPKGYQFGQQKPASNGPTFNFGGSTDAGMFM